MKPELVPGIEGSGRDDQDEEDGAPEEIPEPRENMTVEQLNEMGLMWRKTFTGKTMEGVRIRHPTHAETATSTRRSNRHISDL
jgi:hypothetical protein